MFAQALDCRIESMNRPFAPHPSSLRQFARAALLALACSAVGFRGDRDAGLRQEQAGSEGRTIGRSKPNEARQKNRQKRREKPKGLQIGSQGAVRFENSEGCEDFKGCEDPKGFQDFKSLRKGGADCGVRRLGRLLDAGQGQDLLRHVATEGSPTRKAQARSRLCFRIQPPERQRAQ